MISKEIIEQIKQSASIQDVIGEYVVLKQKGKDFVGLCPFHNESTPSFSISPSKGLYHCFGCKASGDVFSFLQEIGNNTFIEVVKQLADRQSIELPDKVAFKQKYRTIDCLETSVEYYQNNLKSSKGDAARAYLQSRGLNNHSLDTFKLGLALDSWNGLLQHLLSLNYTIDELVSAGLVIKTKIGEYCDRFRDRLMFPIFNSTGKVIAFSGRSLGQQEPKYLHSPETPIFKKGKVLYGLHLAKKAIKDKDKAIVVEGNFDVIALHQEGITNAVATMGTSLTQHHLTVLANMSSSRSIVLAFDNDNAGNKATNKTITDNKTLLTSGQLNLNILAIPNPYKDFGDLLINPNKSSITTLLKTSSGWINWLINYHLASRDLNKPEDFNTILRFMLKVLSQLSPELQIQYLPYCAEILSKGNSNLIKLYVDRLHKGLYKPIVSAETNDLSNNSSPINPFYALIQYYLFYPQLRVEISELVFIHSIVFKPEEYKLLWQALSKYVQDDLTSEGLIKNLQTDIAVRSLPIPYLFTPKIPLDLPLVTAKSIVGDLIYQIKIETKKQTQVQILQQWQSCSPSDLAKLAELSSKLT